MTILDVMLLCHSQERALCLQVDPVSAGQGVGDESIILLFSVTQIRLEDELVIYYVEG